MFDEQYPHGLEGVEVREVLRLPPITKWTGEEPTGGMTGPDQITIYMSEIGDVEDLYSTLAHDFLHIEQARAFELGSAEENYKAWQKEFNRQLDKHRRSDTKYEIEAAQKEWEVVRSLYDSGKLVKRYW